jgi:ABC-type transport system involved in multi-copper enzyme maturation permease subunit
MLGSAHITMILFSIFMGISLFQKELQMGSISMLLSKPVSRTSFLFGKYLGQILVQLGVMLAITGIIISSLMRFETVQYIAVLQALLLMFFETCIVTAVTYFFSVNSGGITTALSTFVMFVIGHYSFSSAQSKSFSSKPVTQIILSAVPNLEVFNLKTFASYGVTISNLEIILSMTYALVCVAMFLVAAALTFHRKDILT